MPGYATETNSVQQIEEPLWKAADKLRNNVDAAEYRHAVLGRICLEYISDSFEEHRQRLADRFKNKDDEYFLGNASADTSQTSWKTATTTPRTRYFGSA